MTTSYSLSADALAAKNRALACSLLNLYVVVVRLPMLPLTAVQRAELVADANRIRAVILC